MDPVQMMQMMALLSMIIDAGWKVVSEVTRNMTPDELDAFIADKENSVAMIKAELDALYGGP